MSQDGSKQSPDSSLANDFAQGSRNAKVYKAPVTSPKAGRDPVQPHNRGNQGQN